MATSQHYPDRSEAAKIVNITATFFMTFFASWRLIVRFRINPRLGWSDYWIFLALLTALAGHGFLLAAAYNGEGKVDADPFLTQALRTKATFLVHVGGSLNMYAMFLAKLSICAYLLALDFSRIYRNLVYISIVLVIICNLTLPMIAHWASCTPIQRKWDRSVKGTCWAPTFNVATTYIQGVVNVLTDFLYAAAPMIYLRRVNLSRYTQWGVRGVFLMALLGTGVSIAKPIQFGRLFFYIKGDRLYHSVATTALSTTENTVCIIVACLPPLRRTFDNLLRSVLPDRILEKIGANKNPSADHALPSYYSTKSRHGNARNSNDGESTAQILADEEYVEDANGKIVKTTRMSAAPGDTTEFGGDGQNMTFFNHRVP